MLFGRLLLSYTAMILLRSGTSLSVVPTPVDNPKDDWPTKAPIVKPTISYPTLRPTMHPTPRPTMHPTRVPRPTPTCDPNAVKTGDDLEKAILAASRGDGSVTLCNTNPIQINRPLTFNFGTKVTLRCILGPESCAIQPAAGYSGHFLTLGGTGMLNVVGMNFQYFVGTASAGVLVVNRSSLGLADCLCSENKGIGGGCVASYGGTLTIQSSLFANNNATANGGAVLVADGGAASIIDTTFNNNNAYTGGAVAFVNGGTSSIVDCNFASNHASYEGGAIWQNQTSTLTVTNSLFVTNAARTAGGAFANVDSKITVVNGNKFFNQSAAFGGAGFVSKKIGIEMDSSNQFVGNGAGTCANVWVYDARSCIPPKMVTSEA